MIFGFSETMNLEKAYYKMRVRLWPVMIKQWQVWPAAQIINFFVLPMNYRVLMANGVGFFWVIYLTYISHKKFE